MEGIRQIQYLVVKDSDARIFTSALASVEVKANKGSDCIADGPWEQTDLHFAVGTSGTVLQTTTFYALVRLERIVKKPHI